MKYIDEYRDKEKTQRILTAIRNLVRSEWNVMEVCGGQTHTILKYGLDEVLPESITLLHGPGCPVCVTPVSLIDNAISLAQQEHTILCSFGDMLRVPGSTTDLRHVKAHGHDVRVVLSPLEAITIARDNPDHQIVFFAIGFETTAPSTALAVEIADQLHLANFSLLVSLMLIPPAMELIMTTQESNVHAFIAPGHVCTVMGIEQYRTLSRKYHIPIVVTGFEPIDLLLGILMCIKQLEQGCSQVEIQYSRAVRPDGNHDGQRHINKVFQVAKRDWRGIGFIPRSGLELQPQYQKYNVSNNFDLSDRQTSENSICIMGDILRGLKKPVQCPSFEVNCTPDTPLGAPMVSSEGACAAYYRYKKQT